jgi:hypothetical protein
MILIVGDGGIPRVVTIYGSGLSLHLLVLTVGGFKVRFELGPSFFNGVFLVQPPTCAHEVTSYKYFCIPNVDLFWMANEDAPLLRNSWHNIESA